MGRGGMMRSSTKAHRCRTPHGIHHLRKLEAHEAAAGLEHAPRLPERRRAVGDVADAKRDRVGVKGVVGKRQALGVALDPRQAAGQAFFVCGEGRG